MWERPLADIGIEVDSDDPDVFAQLDYEPVLPDPTLGEPVATFISDVEIVGDAGQEVAWVFDDDAAGRYLVIESPSGATQADLEAPAHLIPGCHTTSPVIEGADPPVECVLDDFSLVAIRGDVSALVVENQYVTAVSWLEPMTVRDPDTFADFGNLTLEIEIMAPAGGATLDELVDIADRF
jgi:hypothetical protein